MSFAQHWPNANPENAGSGGADNPPPDGKHQVVLVDGGAWTAKSSGNETLKFEFRTVDGRFEWPSIGGWSTQSNADYAAKALEALGLDFKVLRSLEQIDAAVKSLVGRFFTVTVKRNGEYVNTYIDGPAQGVQQAADFSAPQPAAPVPAAAGAGSDSDIPF